MSETVTFEFPRELVKEADPGRSPDYWRDLAIGGDYSEASSLAYWCYAAALDWQEANRLKVTSETPNGTEVKIVNREWEHLDEPILFVGVDPTEPDRYAVVVDGDELLRFVEWEKLRIVEEEK